MLGLGVGEWVRCHCNSRNSKHGWRRFRCAIAAAFALVANASVSRSDSAQCQHPNLFAPALASPQNRVGEYEIPLLPPDYSDPKSVQEHLSYSLVWRGLLIQALGTQTAGRCSTVISTSLFPNLRVLLIDNARVQGQEEAARPHCLGSLHNILKNWRPSEAAIADASASEAYSRSNSITGPLNAAMEANNILRSALGHIYARDSAMHALVSIEPALFQSLVPSKFLTWLMRQQSNSEIGLTPLEFCRGGEGHYLPGEEPKARFPYSSTIPPSAVLRIESVPHQRRGVGHVVIVGEGTAINFSLSNPPAIAKYCNREHAFSDGSNSALDSHRATIRCVRTLHYDAAWTVFFCDPADCRTQQLAESVTTKIANDPDVIALGRGTVPHERNQGPYLVIVAP